MSNKEDKISKSYKFLKDKEIMGLSFTLEELSAATDWSHSTIKTYLSKKWSGIVQGTSNNYTVEGVSKYSEVEYSKMMSQVNKNSQAPFKPDLDENVERLVVKSRESALLALDIYNRPATLFKSEGFIVMMIIAWTSLLHAIFEKQGVKYNHTYPDGTDQIIDGDLKAWELVTCISNYYGKTEMAVQKNIQFMIGLRNKIEHRYAPKIDNHIGGECQALLLNFDELLTKEFTNYYALKDLMVFPLQTANLKDAGRLDVIKKFQGKQYEELKEYIDTYRDGINDEVYNDPKYSFRVFLVPKIGNHRNSSDIALEFVKYDSSNPSELENHKQLIALIKDKVVKIGNPDGLKPKAVVERVAKGIGRPFSMYHHTLAWKMYGCRPKTFEKGHYNNYCYSDTAHGDYVFTPEWVRFLIQKLSSDKEYNRLLGYKG